MFNIDANSLIFNSVTINIFDDKFFQMQLQAACKQAEAWQTANPNRNLQAIEIIALIYKSQKCFIV